MTRLFVIITALIGIAVPAHAHDPSHDTGGQDFEGVWQNEAGSVVTLQVDEDGGVSGHYQTELGNPDNITRFPLTGFMQGDVLAFSVNFEGFGSITTWSGQMSEDDRGRFIRTMWLYSRDVAEEDEAEELWRSVVNGSATFRPLSPDET